MGGCIERKGGNEACLDFPPLACESGVSKRDDGMGNAADEQREHQHMAGAYICDIESPRIPLALDTRIFLGAMARLCAIYWKLVVKEFPPA